MSVQADLRAMLESATSARQNVENQFRTISDELTTSYKYFDSAMSKALTGPGPSQALTEVANSVNNLYSPEGGNIVEYFKSRAKSAVAGYNSMALNHGGEAISSDIDTNHETVSHDSNADTSEIVVNNEFAGEAIKALEKLIEATSEAGAQSINVNIEGAEDIDQAIVANGVRNMEKLNSNYSDIVSVMQKYFTNLQEADQRSLNSIIDSLNNDEG